MESYMQNVAILSALCAGLAVGLLFNLSHRSVGAAKNDSVYPVIDAVKSINLNYGDILVLKFSGGTMTRENRDSIKEQLSNILPAGIKTMIIDQYLDIDSVLKCESSEVKEDNADAHNSNENSPEPFPLSEVS